MGFAGAGATDQDDIAPCGQERPAVQRTDQPLVDRRPLEVEGVMSFTTGSLAAAIGYRIEAAWRCVASARSRSISIAIVVRWR